MRNPADHTTCPLDPLWPLPVGLDATWSDRIGQLDRAIRSQTVPLADVSDLAAAAVLLGRADLAVDLCELCLRHEETNPIVLNNLAAALLLQGQPEEALRHLEKLDALPGFHVAASIKKRLADLPRDLADGAARAERVEGDSVHGDGNRQTILPARDGEISD